MAHRGFIRDLEALAYRVQKEPVDRDRNKLPQVAPVTKKERDYVAGKGAQTNKKKTDKLVEQKVTKPVAHQGKRQVAHVGSRKQGNNVNAKSTIDDVRPARTYDEVMDEF
jgi:hypothetical protein